MTAVYVNCATFGEVGERRVVISLEYLRVRTFKTGCWHRRLLREVTVIGDTSQFGGWLLAVQMGVDFAQQIAWEDSHGSDETAIPRRACWQPATPGALDGGPRTFRSGKVAEDGTHANRGRMHPRSRGDAGARRYRRHYGRRIPQAWMARVSLRQVRRLWTGDRRARVSNSAVRRHNRSRQSENQRSRQSSSGASRYRRTISRRSRR